MLLDISFTFLSALWQDLDLMIFLSLSQLRILCDSMFLVFSTFPTSGYVTTRILAQLSGKNFCDHWLQEVRIEEDLTFFS